MYPKGFRSPFGFLGIAFLFLTTTSEGRLSANVSYNKVDKTTYQNILVVIKTKVLPNVSDPGWDFEFRVDVLTAFNNLMQQLFENRTPRWDRKDEQTPERTHGGWLVSLEERVYNVVQHKYRECPGWIHKYPNVASHVPPIDLVIVLGGDGTFAYANKLFTESMPPVIVYKEGSLSFLAPFDTTVPIPSILKFDNPNPQVEITQRLRLKCEFQGVDKLKADPPITESGSVPGGESSSSSSVSAVTNLQVSSKPQDEHGSSKGKEAAPGGGGAQDDDGYATKARSGVVINEVAFMWTKVHPDGAGFELSFDDEDNKITVYAKGVLIATPTGSTAYNLAAGGPLVHPSVHSVVVTLICPKLFTQRHFVFPGDTVITVKGTTQALKVMFDGKRKAYLNMDESATVSKFTHDAPVFCNHSTSYDWFGAINQFGWSGRPADQKTDRGPTIRREHTFNFTFRDKQAVGFTTAAAGI